ncbi:hypothetical protein [Sulfurisphaera ohwakuensis]|uniref:Uncharacterized protein n=1 Tax=Sulfurisphaera ohwakuensis TaxID=69656 RepID=A0A650CJP3_SULOH|nr:hypothetical protein [Sulfurisphaera ohwakuensis]MBB5254663.1 hypothetical protein [Sulfurisphaera ohwakuensis]QGR18052.1 hypothetical protein D1869_13280 [Sulfurisphaera ohwakuensis]
MNIEKLEKLYFATVYEIENADDANDLLKRVSKSLFLLLRLIYARKAEISRSLGREITRFFYEEENIEDKVQRLSKIVSLMRYEAVTTNFPYIDFYMQNFVSEMDRLMMTKGYKFFLTSDRKTKTIQ